MIDRSKLIPSVLLNLKIEKLNRMQQATLDQIDNIEDLILLSPTGSGKTLAYLLPLLGLLKGEDKTTQALILVPSRELALQIETVFKQMNVSWHMCCCYGGHSVAEEKRSILGTRPEIIVGTPGRVLDHLRRGVILTDEIQTLIIDEFDKSLEFGFHEEMSDIIKMLPSLKKRMLISATDTPEIPLFTGVKNPVKLNFIDDAAEENDDRLKQMQVISPLKDKLETLYALLCTLGSQSSIVFCNHRESVDRVCKLLGEKKMEVGRFHGGMEQVDREKALYKFRNKSCNVLISTDLAARGLDIPEVEHIIHYHLPLTEEAFIHRNGRTARWDATGTSYIILYSEEPSPSYLSQPLETFHLPSDLLKPSKPIWQTLYIGKGKKDKLSKGDIAGFFYKKGRLTHEDIGSIDIKEHYSFVAVKRSKVKQLLALIHDEKIKNMKTIIEIAY